jgi:hypothetical protein
MALGVSAFAHAVTVARSAAVTRVRWVAPGSAELVAAAVDVVELVAAAVDVVELVAAAVDVVELLPADASLLPHPLTASPPLPAIAAAVAKATSFWCMFLVDPHGSWTGNLCEAGAPSASRWAYWLPGCFARVNGPLRSCGRAGRTLCRGLHPRNRRLTMIAGCRWRDRRWVRRRAGIRAVATAGAVAVGLCACGGGSPAGGQAPIREALARWAGATSAREECASLSSGYRFFIGNGNYFDCVRDIARTLGPVVPRRVSVTSIRIESGQAVVRGRIRPIGGSPSSGRLDTFYLVRQDGTWKLNSTGVREGLGPPAPGAPGTPRLKH